MKDIKKTMVNGKHYKIIVEKGGCGPQQDPCSQCIFMKRRLVGDSNCIIYTLGSRCEVRYNGYYRPVEDGI